MITLIAGRMLNAIGIYFMWNLFGNMTMQLTFDLLTFKIQP